MIIEICFIVSSVVCILFSIIMASGILGNRIVLPLPLLNLVDVDVTNSFMYTPSITFQVWFWVHHYGLFI